MECSVKMTRHLQGINKVLIPNFLFFPFPSLPDPVVSLRGCLAFPSPCPGFVPAPLPSSSSTWGEAHLQVSAPSHSSPSRFPLFPPVSHPISYQVQFICSLCSSRIIPQPSHRFPDKPPSPLLNGLHQPPGPTHPAHCPHLRT